MKKSKPRSVLMVSTGRILLGSMLLLVASSLSLAAPVGQIEAERVAQVWYGQSLIIEESKFTDEQLSILWQNFYVDKVRYVLEDGRIDNSKSDSQKTLAYIIEFSSGGYVVVTADDRINPVIIYSLDKEIGEGESLAPFTRFYLTKDFPSRFPIRSNQVDSDWAILRSSTIPEREGPHSFKDPNDVYVLWDTAEWGQGPPYNDVIALFNGNNPNVASGCTATAMAIKMRFHSWPPQGVGSHNYFDTEGAVQFPHFANFGATSYDWSEMPATSLAGLPSAPEVAELMYHCAVSVDMDFEEFQNGGSGAWPSPDPFWDYFDYPFNLHNGPSPAPDPDIVLSIKGGLPVICSSSDHTVVIDGYRDTGFPFFHLNCGWDGNSNGWYQIYGGFPPENGDDFYDVSIPCSQPSHYVYVDNTSFLGENGSLPNPWDTLAEGLSDCPASGELWIRSSTYSEIVTFDRPMTVKAWDGSVTIGMMK